MLNISLSESAAALGPVWAGWRVQCCGCELVTPDPGFWVLPLNYYVNTGRAILGNNWWFPIIHNTSNMHSGGAILTHITLRTFYKMVTAVNTSTWNVFGVWWRDCCTMYIMHNRCYIELPSDIHLLLRWLQRPRLPCSQTLTSRTGHASQFQIDKLYYMNSKDKSYQINFYDPLLEITTELFFTTLPLLTDSFIRAILF